MKELKCWIDIFLDCPFGTDNVPDSKVCHNYTQSQLSAALASMYRIGIVTNNMSMLKGLEKELQKKKVDPHMM